MEKLLFLKKNENKIVLFLLTFAIFFHSLYFVNILLSNYPKIVEDSDFYYGVFTLSRIMFEMPIALFLIAIFKSNNYKHYLVGCLLWSVLPTQLLYVSIQEIIIYLSNYYINEQYIRSFATLFALIGLLFLYIKEKTLKTFFIFTFSFIYVLITLFSHLAIIEGWWANNFTKRIKNIEIIQKEDNPETVLKMCHLEQLTCFNQNFEEITSYGYAVKDWQIKNLNTMLNNKKNLKSYYFVNNVLTFTNENPFVKKNMDYNDANDTSVAIKILFAKNINDLFIVDTQVTKEINNLRFYYGLFNFFAGLVWIFGSILLLKVHKNRINKKIWF